MCELVQYLSMYHFLQPFFKLSSLRKSQHISLFVMFNLKTWQINPDRSIIGIRSPVNPTRPAVEPHQTRGRTQLDPRQTATRPAVDTTSPIKRPHMHQQNPLRTKGPIDLYRSSWLSVTKAWMDRRQTNGQSHIIGDYQHIASRLQEMSPHWPSVGSQIRPWPPWSVPSYANGRSDFICCSILIISVWYLTRNYRWPLPLPHGDLESKLLNQTTA